VSGLHANSSLNPAQSAQLGLEVTTHRLILSIAMQEAGSVAAWERLTANEQHGLLLKTAVHPWRWCASNSPEMVAAGTACWAA
jgi:hypothetical protein